MAKTLEQLLSLSSIIANETKAGANTALRVGGLFSDIIYYLRDLDYAGKDDIPSLDGYATEQWVLGKGYATTSDLDARIDALVNGAPQAYDTLKEIADVLAGNVDSIADILDALGTKVSKTDFNTAIANVNSSISALNTELSGKIDLKLDAVTFNELFEKVQLEDGTWAIKAKLGLFSDSFLSAKGANTNGGSTPSGGGLITSLYRYADLGKTFSDTNNDTFNAYTINKINSDLGSRISVLEGKATNVSFTQSLTSGTQIGTITIDGASKNIYAPTIPTNLSQFTDDVVSGKYLPLSGGEVGSLLISSASNTPLTIKTTSAYAWSGICFLNNNGVSVGNIGIDNNRPIFVPKELNDIMYILHSGNYTDYTYSQSTIDTKLGGYLPLSGGMITGGYSPLTIDRNDGEAVYITYRNYSKVLGYLGFENGVPSYTDTNWGVHTLIHSGNIGSQGVASAAKLTTARSIWGQSFDGTGNVSGHLTGASSLRFGGDVGLWQGNLWSALNSDDIAYNAARHVFWGNVLIGTTTDNGAKLQVNGGISATSAITTSSAITTTFRGGGISGLYPDSWISGANANRLWLYNDYELAIYGSTIELMSSVNVSGTLHATTGIWSDGYVSAKGQNTSSDMRLKNVLNKVVLGVKDIANAPSVRFSWKNGGGVDVGSSAQYWQGLLPDAVKERDGMLEMQYANIALLSAIALAKNFETIDERIARLEKENEELRNEISMMKGGLRNGK